jgi:hypothetical protein
MNTTKGSYRTVDGKAQIDWELVNSDKGAKFSASGEYRGSCGQCLEAIAKDYPQDKKVQEICAVWREYHLNDMKPGTPEQEAEVQRRLKIEAPKHPECYYDDGSVNCHHLASVLGTDSFFSLACQWLKEANLYEVKIGEKRMNISAGDGGNITVPVTYKYGQAWLYQPIPENVLKQIESWATLPPHKPLHEDKATAFIKEAGLRMRITRSDSKPAPWATNGESGHHYRVTISRKSDLKKRIVFDFWGSIHDASEGKAPPAYDVLSCISSDAHAPESFEDYCAYFGEDQDSRKALQTFNRLDKFARRLRAFFSPDEIEQLSTIH